MLKDNLIFFKEFIHEFKSTGGILPTSRWAAKAMVVPLRDRKQPSPIRILELGSGTGSVTVKILEQMTERDELSICEINPRFMTALKARLKKLPAYQRHARRITFYGCAAQELPEKQKFDVVVCALPFLNFDVRTVEEIFSKLRALSTSETVMTYYEYKGLRKFGLFVSPPARKARMRQLDSFFAGIFENHLKNRESVWANMLPINVYMLKKIASLPEAV